MPLRILIVEDDPVIGMALSDDLRGDSHEVRVATRIAAGLQEATGDPPDVILLDLTLPDGDGVELCRALRRGGHATPVIMLTARADEGDKVLGLEAGADDYVTKPYGARELRARIAAVLRRGVAPLPDSYRFGDVEVSQERREVRRGGRPVAVTALEFRLLTAFITHRGKALSRQQLIDEVWGRDTFVVDRVVDNQVAKLRKKIEPKPEEPRFLLNLRGFGYRFDG